MNHRLDSWKAIAGYLRKSVRTVRRWEVEEDLPVHRHVHHRQGTVYAYSDEIDLWQRSGRRAVGRVQVASVGSVAAAGPAASAAPEPAIVVLPLLDLGGAADDLFADGLSEEIIAELSKVRSLRVISATSSRTLKGTSQSLRAIGAQLGVGFILEGSVRRAGSRLRVAARLVDAAVDEAIWSEQYDGTMDDLFDIQERLARTIVHALQIQLSADEDRRLSERPVGDAAAYQCYLQARQEAYRWRRESIDHAVQLLHNGLRIVGDNAELYAALGRTHLQYRESGIDLSDAPLLEAERCARRVAELDPASRGGAALLGWIRYAQGDIRSAVRALEDARVTDPACADVLALLCNCYLISGRVARARPLIAGLLSVDPLTPLSRCMPGFADLMEGRLELAVPPYREMYEMDPANPMARLFYIWVLGLNGQTQAAIEAAGPAAMAAGHTLPERLAGFLADALAGRPSQRAWQLQPQEREVASASEMFARFLAYGYAWAGEHDEAVRWLAIAVERGFINHPFVSAHSPAFDNMRAMPAFRALLDDMRQRWAAFEG